MAAHKSISEVELISPAPMTQEQATEKSWEFIDITANKVAKLPESVQNDIKASGLRLVDSGTEYVHVVDIQQIQANQQKDQSKSKSKSSQIK